MTLTQSNADIPGQLHLRQLLEELGSSTEGLTASEATRRLAVHGPNEIIERRRSPLVRSVEENTISLTNGCVCCEIREDLVASVEDLLQRSDSIDYVILEASGIADPAGIVMTSIGENLQLLQQHSCRFCFWLASGHCDELHVLCYSGLLGEQVFPHFVARPRTIRLRGKKS